MLRYIAMSLVSLAVVAVCLVVIVWLLRDGEFGGEAPLLLADAGRAIEDTVDLAREAQTGLELLAAQMSGAPQARDWTHIDGRIVRAVLVDANTREVTIRREADGRVFRVALTALSKADRDYVRAWLSRRELQP
ncbi:MAG: hypothetical protein D6781_01505 [Verrucomicrobia bacterium]|nr:MAG: hypothetical protein D6781_01505 [Verrucomicrobiota bacterium]